jgi:hypothetical protein
MKNQPPKGATNRFNMVRLGERPMRPTRFNVKPPVSRRERRAQAAIARKAK